MPAPVISFEDMPPGFRIADSLAVRSRRRFILIVQVQIAGLIVPVLAGTIDAAIDGEQRLLTYVSLVSLIVVATSRLLQRFSGHASTWHSQRAVAEAIRSLTWRFTAGGSDFHQLSDEHAISVFDQRIEDLGLVSEGLEMNPSHVTSGMLALRRAPFEVRRAGYTVGRLINQHDWYHSRAIAALQRARLWDLLFVSSAVLAIFFGIIRVTGIIALNLISLFGLIAAVIGTWTGVNHFDSLAATYGNTAEELKPMRNSAANTDRGDWPAFVERVEEIISREHSVWVTKRR